MDRVDGRRSVVRAFLGYAPAQAERRIAAMGGAFEDAKVTGYVLDLRFADGTNYAAAAGSKRHTTALGQAFDLGAGVTAQCVCINGKTISGDSIIRNSEENNNSQGLLITYGRFRMIFATDMGLLLCCARERGC